jgi:hypothetical protein
MLFLPLCIEKCAVLKWEYFFVLTLELGKFVVQKNRIGKVCYHDHRNGSISQIFTYALLSTKLKFETGSSWFCRMLEKKNLKDDLINNCNLEISFICRNLH